MAITSTNLRTLRESRRLTQAAVAERLGVVQSVISDMETGQFWPRYERIQELAAVFKVEPVTVVKAALASREVYEAGKIEAASG